MAGKRDPSTEAVRTLRSLWRATPSVRPGPTSALSLDALVTTAIAIADTEGLAKLSIRRVATELGISPMSVYTHVATKAELLELMTDTAHGELADPGPVAERWQDRIAEIARTNLDLLIRHPWLVEQPPGRPPLGPGTTGKYERELTALDGLGLDDITLDAALSFVLGFVRGAARDRIAAQNTVADSETDEQWWAARAATLAELMPAEDYPLAVRVGSAAGAAQDAAWDPLAAFEFGLARVIDGLAPLLDQHGDR
ncbi:TetR/AcrR family transcriptional regulator [Enhygromyxa salina]|uniref:TetR/AcrR family transcriptional regulator n=1 Tax=Enhygromyxa salina TaxID=215803 RepID=UPI001C62D70A|nr:TetR/AcrR family transcriptional regulator [Enhygromyxa salina]